MGPLPRVTQLSRTVCVPTKLTWDGVRRRGFAEATGMVAGDRAGLCLPGEDPVLGAGKQVPSWVSGLWL